MTLDVCATAVNQLHPVERIDSAKTIYLVNHGWHVGIALQRSDIPDKLWPESKEFYNAHDLEVGWGDEDYYQTPNPHLGIAIKAILWPTTSVLRIVGFNATVTSYFAFSEIIQIHLSDDGFKRLVHYIATSHQKNPDGISKPIAKGLYGNSQFYLSEQTYHLFNTCNVWTAEALHAASCPIKTTFTMTVEGLLSQAKTCGIVAQNR